MDIRNVSPLSAQHCRTNNVVAGSPPHMKRSLIREDQKWKENYYNIERMLQAKQHEVTMLNVELESYKKRNNLLQKQVNTFRLHRKNAFSNNVNSNETDENNQLVSPQSPSKSNHLHVIQNQRLKLENSKLINEVERLKNFLNKLQLENNNLAPQMVRKYK